MPVPTNSRYEQPSSPPSMSATPSRSTHSRHIHTPSTYSPTVTSATGAGQQRLNVVTRVAIEGKAKQGQDGASIRMFLKICLPLDSLTPGSTIPLFPEENVKIHSSQVHPLDHNGVPYNFSSTVSPLLHNAARALNLPPRSQEDFNSIYSLAKSNGNTTSSRSLKPENGENVSPIDVQYTGHILVSGYSISFVLPKVFLPRRRDVGFSDTEGGTTKTSTSRRRYSIGEKHQVFFMAAIDMWVPFLGRPPRSPYLLSIPSPRCLHNYIKLRIFPPPVTASSSFASLSSVEEDGAAWDLTSEPHVTRNVSTRPSRSRSYNHFADDESSDSSGTNDACVIQGTFPSAERIRIRWAKPTRQLDIPGNENSSRRRVGVEESKGDMVCIVRGKGKRGDRPDVEGILMHVEYKGQCAGIWYAGVATLLGLDVSIVAKGSEISWPQGYPDRWEVSGSTGFTGFDNGLSSPPQTMSSRTTSLESNTQPPALSTSANGINRDSATTFLTTRTNSNSSLLHAPLPVQNVGDYSFEGSTATLAASSALSPGSETLSSIASLPISSGPNLPPSSPPGRDPGIPITLHLNMNELQNPRENIFSYTISGTILVTPKTALGRLNGSTTSANGKVDADDLETIVLPRFTVLAANSESTSITIRNEVDGATVEVFNPTGDTRHDPQTRKTVLSKNGFTKCNEDGGRIALKYFDTLYPDSSNHSGRPRPRPRTPSNGIPRVSASSPIPRAPFPTRSKPDGPCIIHWVKATVTALAPNINNFPTGYAVRVTLQTPPLGDSEWLEFGVACGSADTHHKSCEHRQDKVRIICASLDGVPVRTETNKVTKLNTDSSGAPAFEELAGKDWICWGKVHVGSLVGGTMVIDYIVKETFSISRKGAKKWKDSSDLDILLPTFFVPIARLEVYIDLIPGLDIVSLCSNFDYQYALPEGNRLLRYSVDEFNQPQLSLSFRKTAAKHAPLGMKWFFIPTWIIFLVAFLFSYSFLDDVRQLRRNNDGYFGQVDSWPDIPTVTVTTTVHSPQWLTESSDEVFALTANLPPMNNAPTPTPTPTPLTSLQNVEGTSTPLDQPPHGEILEATTLTNALSPRFLFENYGLMPFENIFKFTWSSENSNSLKRGLEKLVGTMEVVWDIFRRVYHYPLDPP